MAPEMLRGAYDEKVDVWAAGVLLYVLLTGRHPFRGPSQSATEARIKEASPALDGPPLDDASPAAVDLVRALLSPTADQRPSAKQALRHAWLRERLNQEARALPSTIPAALQALCAQEHWNGGVSHSPTSSAASRDGGGGGVGGGGGGGGGGNKAGQLAKAASAKVRACSRARRARGATTRRRRRRRARAVASPPMRSGPRGSLTSQSSGGRRRFHLTVAAASGAKPRLAAALEAVALPASAAGGASASAASPPIMVAFAAHEGCGGRRGDGRERGGSALRRRA